MVCQLLDIRERRRHRERLDALARLGARGPDLRLGEAAPAGPGRVLVVDDQRNMRITTAIVLRQAGSEVAEAVAAAERRSIEAALLRCDGDLGRVARDLAISPTTLWRKMKRLAIEAGAAS